MSILSITFHAVENVRAEWENYTTNTLVELAENLMDVERYILSEVHSNMINEGSNTNLLLMFENDDYRMDFLQSEFLNIEERIQNEFGDQVMVFMTLLNPKIARL